MIIRDGNRVIYVSKKTGKRYIIYKGVDILKQGTVDDNEMIHYMAFAVGEDPDEGACVGWWYITGFSDEELLECCEYIDERKVI